MKLTPCLNRMTIISLLPDTRWRGVMLDVMVTVGVKLFKGRYEYLTCPVKPTPYLNHITIIVLTTNAKDAK